MKSKGADIRLFDLKKDTILEKIHDYIAKEKLHNVDVISDGKKTTIRAQYRIDSIVSLFWSGKPQVIEWNIVEIDEDKTRVEIRFGLVKKYRLWFWTVYGSAITCFLIVFDIGMTLNKNNQANSTSIPFFLSLIILASLILKTSNSEKVYELYINNFIQYCKVNLHDFNVEILQDNCDYPDGFAMIAVLPIMIIIMAVMHFDTLSNDIGKIVIIILSAMFVIFLLYCACMYYPGLVERIRFALIGIAVAFAISVICNLPYINSLKITL